MLEARRPIKITNLEMVERGIDTFEPTAIVSIINPALPERMKPVLTGVPHTLQLVFDDIEAPYAAYEPPREGHVRRIIRFAEATQGERTLFHCHAGISRSTAAALITLLVDGRDVFDSIRWVRTIRPSANPNALMIRYYLDTLTDLHTQHTIWQAFLGAFGPSWAWAVNTYLPLPEPAAVAS